MNAQNWKKDIAGFLSAQTVSLFGSSLVQYAIVWYITLSTSSGKMLTISTLCGFLPQIAISLFAGVWIDRYNRKWMIMLSDTVIAAATLALALTFLSGHRSMGLLFLVLIVRSAGTGIQTPAVNAVLPQIVPQQHLMRINGINSTLSSIIMFLSPAASGAILTVAPLETVLFIDVVTAVIGVGITSTIRIRPLEKNGGNEESLKTTVRSEADGNENDEIKDKKPSQFDEIREGFAYLKKNAFVKNLLVYQITILFLISPSAFLTPLMVSRTFGPEVFRLTASEMTYSLGMVLGGLLITAWGGFKKRMNTTMAAGAFYGILMIGMGAAPLFLIYLCLNTLIGITSPCYNAPITVSVQEKVEPAMHGRIFSLMQIATSCALPFGMVIFGPMADVIRVQWILIGAGSAVVAASFYMWVSRKF